MRKFRRMVDVLVRVEALIALAIMLPTGAVAMWVQVGSLPSWTGGAAVALGILVSYGLVMWWGERRLRAGKAEWAQASIGESQEPLSAPTAAAVGPAAEHEWQQPELDEPLVILCRRYALPAYEALNAIIPGVTAQCFALGGWHGLAARLLKDHVIPKSDLAAENVNASIDGTRGTLAEDLGELVREYNTLAGYVYHFGKSDLALNLPQLDRWATRDKEFEKQLADLAAGIDRDNLAALSYPSEARALLHGLRERS